MDFFFDANSKRSKLLKVKADIDCRYHGSFVFEVGLGLPLEGWVELDQTSKKQNVTRT